MLLTLLSKDPLLIERSCSSQAVPLTDAEHTPAEIKSFLHESIKARFNSDEENPHILSVIELKKRVKEQAALKKQSMRQIVLIEDISFNDDNVIVKTNRLIAVQDIRSAFIFKLNVKFAKVKRSKLNPYGLILTDVSPIQPTPKDKKDKK